LNTPAKYKVVVTKNEATANLFTVRRDLIKATVATMATAPNPIRHMDFITERLFIFQQDSLDCL